MSALEARIFGNLFRKKLSLWINWKIPIVLWSVLLANSLCQYLQLFRKLSENFFFSGFKIIDNWNKIVISAVSWYTVSTSPLSFIFDQLFPGFFFLCKHTHLRMACVYTERLTFWGVISRSVPLGQYNFKWFASADFRTACKFFLNLHFLK